MALHFVERLARLPGVEVVEPGVVRQTLLKTRMIQEGGLSLAQADVLRAMLDVDLVVAGRVAEYQDLHGVLGAPLVEFAVQGIDAAKRQVVWTSFSYNRGDDGVFFFDSGRVYTAHALASKMAGAVVEKFLGARSGRERSGGEENPVSAAAR
jgi:hypothetical protein